MKTRNNLEEKRFFAGTPASLRQDQLDSSRMKFVLTWRTKVTTKRGIQQAGILFNKKRKMNNLPAIHLVMVGGILERNNSLRPTAEIPACLKHCARRVGRVLKHSPKQDSFRFAFRWFVNGTAIKTPIHQHLIGFWMHFWCLSVTWRSTLCLPRCILFCTAPQQLHPQK